MGDEGDEGDKGDEGDEGDKGEIFITNYQLPITMPNAPCPITQYT
ncbi:MULTISPECIES: histidine kinase [unclassified Tolypothrix]|nr:MULTISPECIES: histidine kinase [unclassified Tolypothrix]EKF01206.1 hypothetical protein FDUTEX481_08086 [Tolypothrix sp. PCC 7601]UYD24781.1 histidine kinase [Tolypothrix sp. PCC 7712]UYD32988.1 histidine kinase [Tolypothrix sp. PCC 7601]